MLGLEAIECWGSSSSQRSLSLAQPILLDLAVPTLPKSLGNILSPLSSTLQLRLRLLPSLSPFSHSPSSTDKDTPLDFPNWTAPLPQIVFPFSPPGPWGAETLSVSQLGSGSLANRDDKLPSLKGDIKVGKIFLAKKNLTSKEMTHLFILILKYICF